MRTAHSRRVNNPSWGDWTRSNSSIEESELAEDLPLDVDVFLLSRLDDTVMHAEVLINWKEHPTLVADEGVDCPHHAEGDDLSTLGELGEAYADLRADLIEVAALMCDLPEYEAELERYVTGRVAFELTTCYEELLTFAFGFRVADGIVRAYQDHEHELGEQLGIPIEPSVEELVSGEK